jgi:hypothetical protein
MFAVLLRRCRQCVSGAGHADAMAELFEIIGLITVVLIGVTCWLEER